MNWRNKRSKSVHAGRSPQQMACGARMTGNMRATFAEPTCEVCAEERRKGYKELPAMVSVYELVDALREAGYPVERDDSVSALRRLWREIEEVGP